MAEVVEVEDEEEKEEAAEVEDVQSNPSNTSLQPRKRTSREAQLPQHRSQGSNKSRMKRSAVTKALVYKATKDRREKLLQCAGYALGLISHGGLRTHVIGVLIGEDMLELLYFDHSIHARSERISFEKNPTLLVAAVHALLRLDDSGWGYDPILKSPTHFLGTNLPIPREPSPKKIYDVFKGTELRLNSGCVLILENDVFHQHALIGRGTAVVKATVKVHDVDGKSKEWPASLTVKFSYSAETREESEYDLVASLRREATKEKKTNILKRLPNMVHSERCKLDGAPARMAEALNGVKEGFYERRVLNVIVQEELYRIETLVDEGRVADFGKAVEDLAECKYHHILRFILISRFRL